MIRVRHVICDLSAGGAERVVLDLCRLRAPDMEVGVITVQGAGPLLPAFVAAGVPVRIGGRPRGHLGLRALRRIVDGLAGADVVHTHLFAGDTWGRAAARIAGRPVVTTEHNVNRDETWQRHVKRALAGSGPIVAVSEAVAAWSREVDRVPIAAVIPNGVDLERVRPRRPGDGTRVLAVGRRVPQKGFDVLLDALPEGMTLTVVGEGPYAPAHPRVTWLGRRDDVPALMAAHDILAVPSRWEGFGLVAAEGLAAGMAVVASAVDGLPEVVGEDGVLVPPGDAVALGDALRRLRDDASLRSRLGAAGAARARERFDVRRMVRRYETIYRDLARR